MLFHTYNRTHSFMLSLCPRLHSICKVMILIPGLFCERICKKMTICKRGLIVPTPSEYLIARRLLISSMRSMDRLIFLVGLLHLHFQNLSNLELPVSAWLED